MAEFRASIARTSKEAILRIGYAIIIVLICAGVTWAQTDWTTQVETLIEQGRYQQAVDLVQQQEQALSGCSAQLLLGRAFMLLGRPLAAREAFDRCLTGEPSSEQQARALAGSARTALLTEETTGAERLSKQADKLLPKDRLVRLAVAETALALGHADQAAAVTEKLLAQDEDDIPALALAAQAAAKQGELEKAYQLLQRLDAVADVDHPLPIIARYRVKLAHNDVEAALKVLDRLQELLPAHVRIAADHARLLQEKEGPQVAIKRLEPALALSPGLTYLLRLRAEFYLAGAIPGRAADDLELLVSRQKAITLDYFLLAEAYRQMRNHQKWLAMGKLLAEQRPDSPDGPHLVGACMDDLDYIAPALQSYSEALKRDPFYTPTLLARADLFIRLDRLGEARADLARVRKLLPDDPRAKVMLASLEIIDGNAASAETLLREVLAVRPNHLEARILLGLVLAQQGNADEAKKLNRELNAHQATPAEMVNGLEMLTLSGSHEEVAAIAGEYLQTHERDYGVRALMVDALVSLGRYSQALTEIEKLNDHWGRSRAGDILRARCLAETGEAEQALMILDEVLQKHPDDRSALYRRGLIRQQQGDLDGALEDLIKLAKSDAEAAAPRLALVRLFIQRQEFDRARAEAYLYVNRTANPCAGWRVRGQVELAAGANRQAVEYLSRALALCPDDAEALAMRAEAYEKLGDAEKAKQDRLHLQRLRTGGP